MRQNSVSIPKARKALGQNFIRDVNINRKIVRLAEAFDGNPISKGSFVEVGPGPGGLTLALLERGANLLAIEKDPRFSENLGALKQNFPKQFEWRQGDARRIDLLSEGQPPRRLVANLPYNQASHMLILWLKAIHKAQGEGKRTFSAMVLMFQKEVGQRLLAEAGEKSYGRLAIICQWLCEVEALYALPPEAFVPKPKVSSLLLGLKPRPHPLFEAEFADLESLTRAAFGQRRKTLRRALMPLAGKQSEAWLKAAKVNPNERAENCDLSCFARLLSQKDWSRNF